MNAVAGAYVVASEGACGWTFEGDDDGGVYLYATKADAQAHIDHMVAYYLRYFKTTEAGQATYKILRLEET